MSRLTDREMACLRLIADGHSNERIMRALDISYAGVARSLASLYRKLGAADRASAVARGFRSGLLN